MVDNTHINPSVAMDDISYLQTELRPEQWNELLAVLEVLHIKLVDTHDELVDIQKRLTRIEKHLGVMKPVPSVPGRRDLQL